MASNPDEFITKLGQNISRIREGRGITQYRLAKDLIMEQSNLARIESGKTNPTVKTLLKICDQLDVSIQELFQFL